MTVGIGLLTSAVLCVVRHAEVVSSDEFFSVARRALILPGV
jgi:hypothetical protein